MKIGTYAIERDYSHYVAYISKTIFAVVSTATKGPINTPTVCTSAQDLVNRFGPLNTDCYGLYAGQYFLSQASKLYFVRAATEDAAEASTNIIGMSSTDTSISDALTIKVVEKGTYANGYSVIVSNGIANDTYNFTVKNRAGITLETLKGISLETLTTDYKTQYIKIAAINSTATKLNPQTYTFSGGNDGIEGISSADYITAGNTLAADTIDMNLFAVPGVSDPEVVVAMLNLAETRGDCLYLVDPPKGLTRDGVISWHNGGGAYEHAAFNSSYGALYYDWVWIYDSVNKTRVQVPPSVPVAASIAYSDRVSELWYAPAGLRRGLIRGVLDSVTKLSKGDTELLYSDDNNINSIYDDPQVGLVLWGQKTLYRADTALNRINVRRLLNYLKRVIVAACNYLTFEPNDRITWNSFENLVNPTLRSIQKRRGLYEYRIVRGETIVTDEDIDNYRMPCMILLRPTKAAEEIPIYFVITSTGADFNDVLEANGVVNDNAVS